MSTNLGCPFGGVQRTVLWCSKTFFLLLFAFKLLKISLKLMLTPSPLKCTDELCTATKLYAFYCNIIIIILLNHSVFRIHSTVSNGFLSDLSFKQSKIIRQVWSIQQYITNRPITFGSTSLLRIK